jgi:hypothetical protein
MAAKAAWQEILDSILYMGSARVKIVLRHHIQLLATLTIEPQGFRMRISCLKSELQGIAA